MQDELLTKANVKIVGLDFTQRGQPREARVHRERQQYGLSRDLTQSLQSALRHFPSVLFLLLPADLFRKIVFIGSLLARVRSIVSIFLGFRGCGRS